MPTRSRILFAEDGILKLSHIDATLAKYSCFSATQLVNITHVVGGPWDSVKKDTLYAEISDCVILERHSREIEVSNLSSGI